MKAKRMLSLVMAARKAFADWDAALARLPSDGQYAAEIAMVEAEGGILKSTQSTGNTRRGACQGGSFPQDALPARAAAG